MKNLTRLTLITFLTGMTVMTSCKKKSNEVQTVMAQQEDATAVAVMDNAFTNMVLHHDSFAHPLSPHHKLKHDKLYHHYDSVYNHHHKIYKHGDTSHHKNVHHILKHHNRHDSLNKEHHKFPH